MNSLDTKQQMPCRRKIGKQGEGEREKGGENCGLPTMKQRTSTYLFGLGTMRAASLPIPPPQILSLVSPSSFPCALPYKDLLQGKLII